MLRKYEINGQPARKTVPVGTMIYSMRFFKPFGNSCFTLGKGPFIVEAWLNREYSKRVAGKYVTVYIRGGHLAVIKDISNGKRHKIADHYLLAAQDNGDIR